MTNAGFRLCSIATPRCDRPTIHSTLDHCYFFVTFSFSFILFSEAASRITSFPLFPFFFFYFQPEERSYWHERSNPSFSSFLPFFLPPPPFFPLCFWFFAIFKSIVTRLTNWLQASLDCDFKREESIQSSALLIPFRSLLLRPSFSIATGTARITSFLTRVFLSFFSPILNSRQRESYSV